MTHAAPGLPPGATAESRLRFQLAQRMAAECPAAWNQALALTGSASRGLADADSDIELNAWGRASPDPDQRAAWLRAIGATETALAVEVTLALLPPTPDIEQARIHLRRGLEVSRGPSPLEAC